MLVMLSRIQYFTTQAEDNQRTYKHIAFSSEEFFI